MKFILALLLMSVSLKASVAPTIGIINNNPGNIRDYDGWQEWKGSVGIDPYGHIVFESSFWGLRAIRLNLKAYYRRGVVTPRSIATRWGSTMASYADRLGYTQVICKYTKHGPDSVLNMKDPKVLRMIARGIVWQENGMDPYSDADYFRAFP